MMVAGLRVTYCRRLVLAVDTGVSCLARYLCMITCQNLDVLPAWR